jgi:hypothetical protein
VSSYKTCSKFNINSNLVRIKYEDHDLNRNIRVILKTYINIATSKLIACISTFYIYVILFAIFTVILID